MENAITTKELIELKRELPQMKELVKKREETLRFIYQYYKEYIKTEYETLYTLRRHNLEYIYSLYQAGSFSSQQRKILFNLLKELIPYYKEGIYDGSYCEFIEQLENKLGIGERRITNIEETPSFFSALALSAKQGMGIIDYYEEDEEEDEMDDDFSFEKELTEEESNSLSQIMRQESLDDLAFFFKHTFWLNFFQIKHKLNRILEKEGDELLSKQERQFYKNKVEGYCVDYDCIGLLKIYLQLIELIVSTDNLEKSGYLMEVSLESLEHYITMLDYYDSPKIPQFLLVNMDENIESLKNEFEGYIQKFQNENRHSAIISTARTDRTLFEDFASSCEPNEESLFGKTVFTLYSLFQTTG